MIFYIYANICIIKLFNDDDTALYFIRPNLNAVKNLKKV